MIGFYDICLNITNPDLSEECSYSVMDSNNIPVDDIKKCVDESTQIKKSEKLANNTILEQDFHVMNQWKIKTLPAIVVNSQTIMGSMKADNLLEAICAGYDKMPEVCYSLNIFIPKKIILDYSWSFIFLIILSLIALNIFLYWVCKKYILRSITSSLDSTDISGKVNTVVSRYLALRDQ
jgi:hypothetical protein